MKNSMILFLAIFFLSISLLGFAFLPYLSSLVEAPDTKTYSSLGEQIYFSGRGENGSSISYSRGQWSRMMRRTCSSCHGDDGKGGFQIMMMSDKEAPSITWEALTEDKHDEHGGEEHPPFDKRTIKRAITKGLGTSGQPLDSIMPRWGMNQTELDAIIDFLKKLD